MLPNEEFALACRAYYEEQGLIVDATNGQFAHCPLPKEMGDKGYYLLWEHHQQQGLLQSRDVDRKCFFNSDVKKWLLEADYFPSNYFELWDIYDYYTREQASVMHTEQAKAKRKDANSDGNGRSSREVIAKQAKTLRDTLAKLTSTQRAEKVAHFRKPVQITFPSGRVGLYPSAVFAAQSIGVHKFSMQKWCRAERKSVRGKFAGYSFRYV